jgi:hypothetical protein
MAYMFEKFIIERSIMKIIETERLYLRELVIADKKDLMILYF